MNYFDKYGNLIKKISKRAVDECSHSGQCADDVKYWVKELKFEAPMDLARRYLDSFGAWDVETLSDQDVLEDVFWCICCQLREDRKAYIVLD